MALERQILGEIPNQSFQKVSLKELIEKEKSEEKEAMKIEQPKSAIKKFYDRLETRNKRIN